MQRPILIGSALALTVALAAFALAQGRGAPMTPEQKAHRLDVENQLEAVAVIERKVMVPMRDGKRMATDIYRC